MEEMIAAFVEYAPLREYEVSYALKGKRYADNVKANSSSDARDLIYARYGKDAKIISVKEVKK